MCHPRCVYKLIGGGIKSITQQVYLMLFINRLTPNDPCMGRTATLTSKRCILNIYSTNVGTEYFKHALYSPFFFSSKCSLFHNANFFGSCIIHILYIECAEIKKKLFRPQRVNKKLIQQRNAHFLNNTLIFNFHVCYMFRT